VKLNTKEISSYSLGSLVSASQPRIEVRILIYRKRPIGPYLVRRKINDIIYEIQRSQKAKSRIVHKDRSCKYNGSIPDWFQIMRYFDLADNATAVPRGNDGYDKMYRVR
jgi:hypothetical protein